MSEYTQQADNFLSSHNLTFRATFKEFNTYFPDDKVGRIYNLTISGKGRGRYSCKFGASIVMTEKDEAPTAYDLLASLTKSDPWHVRGLLCRVWI